MPLRDMAPMDPSSMLRRCGDLPLGVQEPGLTGFSRSCSICSLVSAHAVDAQPKRNPGRRQGFQNRNVKCDLVATTRLYFFLTLEPCQRTESSESQPWTARGLSWMRAVRPGPSDDMTNDRPASVFSSLSVPLPALHNAVLEDRILQMMVR